MGDISSSGLIRIKEVIELMQNSGDDSFFSDFEESCSLDAEKKRYYQVYDKALMALDENSWRILKKKLLSHYRDHRDGQTKQGFFNQMNEAFAYQYLQKLNYQDIQMIKEANTPTPDISYRKDNKIAYCEVKTFGLSCNEIKKRELIETGDHGVYANLSIGAINKFKLDIEKSIKQIKDYSGSSNGMVFIVLKFDDITDEYLEMYKCQLNKVVRDNSFGRLDFCTSLWENAVVQFL